MMLSPNMRKVMLTLHVVTSVGLMGAVACFLVLAVIGRFDDGPQVALFTYPAMALITRLVIVPLAYAALLVGTVQSLGTPWGLFRHWWVVIKLVLTVFVILVLTVQLPVIDLVADAALTATLGPSDLQGPRMALVVHAAGGLAVLLMPMVLSVYKPRGLTAFGWRKRRTPV